MKARLVLIVAAAAAALAIAGCGGGGSASSSTDPASIAPPKSPLFIEVAVQPEGELKSDVESLAESIAGVDDLGGLIVTELEKSASDSGESFDYAKEVEPWLGEKAGISFESYDGDDFSGYGVAVQTTDADATQEFIDKQAKSDGEPAKDGSYEGIDYKVESDDGQTIGIVDDLLVLAEDEATFKHLVDASAGESLADEASFASAIAAAPDDSLADVFVDIGGLIDQSGGSVDPGAKQFLDSAGIDPDEAIAVASLVPGSDQVEIDVSTDLSEGNRSSDNASGMLGSLPADSVVAFASAEFGKRFGEAIDSIDANGIPGEIPPNKLKSGLKEGGIDLEAIAASIGDVGVFAEGSGESDIGAAAVLSAKDAKEATNTVSNIGLFLRATGTPGVTAINGKASGFSIRSDELGPKPLVVAAQGERIAIAYGLPAATKALATDAGQTLADDPVYKEAVGALGGTPISGFVEGPAALRLITAAMTGSEEEQGFEEAKPYLEKVDYLALGSGASGDLATAKLILAVGK
jgi:hypothetical protein